MNRAFVNTAFLIATGWMLVPTAFADEIESKYIELDGVRTHYVDQGQGPALILIHGLGADLTRWSANINTLAQSRRVIALDLVGFGRSEKPSIEYRAQVFVDQVDALMAALGIDTATLIGNSMGGWVSLLFAEQHPDKTDGLVLVAPAFVFGLPDTVSADALTAGASPSTPAAMAAYLDRIYHKADLREATVAAALADKKAVVDKSTVRSVAESIVNRTDLMTPERIKNIHTRTLLIHGNSDGVMPVSASHSIAEMLPNAEMIVQTEAGHWPQLEKAEAFNQDLVSWLDQ